LCLTSESRTSKVNVLKNDTDSEDDVIYLTSAEFVNAADTTLAYITVNAADSTISLTVKPNADIGAGGHIFQIVYNVKDDGKPASQCATGMLTVKAYPTPSYPDIRVRVCPDAGDTINLAKYIDTTDNIKSIHWSHQIPSIAISSPEGKISTSVLAHSRIHTLTYTVSSQCVSEQKRKVYLEMLKNGRVRLPKDTVVICYKYAEAVNINRLIGIEAGGEWEYYSFAPDDVDKYVKQSTSPVYGGAVVMNGKAIYEDDKISTTFYHGVTAKTVKFVYKTADNSCLSGKSYSVVIVLTEDITK
jgi:hypothetical protein